MWTHLLCVSYEDLSLPLTLCAPSSAEGETMNRVWNKIWWWTREYELSPWASPTTWLLPFSTAGLRPSLVRGMELREIPTGMRPRKVMQILLCPNCDVYVHWEQEDTKVRSLDTDRSQRWDGPQRGLRRAVWIWPIPPDYHKPALCVKQHYNNQIVLML